MMSRRQSDGVDGQVLGSKTASSHSTASSLLAQPESHFDKCQVGIPFTIHAVLLSNGVALAYCDDERW